MCSNGGEYERGLNGSIIVISYSTPCKRSLNIKVRQVMAYDGVLSTQESEHRRKSGDY